MGVATQLLHLLEGAPPWGAIDPAKAIPWVEQHTGRTLAASQRAAVAQVLTGKVTVITGGPGVGKTTIVTSILQALRTKRMRVLLCAPTGRAAKRLSEATGLEAKTIHRLLEFDPKGLGFLHNTTNPLAADLVVIDEVSMVDVVLMAQLLRAIPAQAAVLLVGDVDQLPSVGPGAVLADIIASGRIPTVTLTEIFRQAASSHIIVNQEIPLSLLRGYRIKGRA
jgi:exodeoxyribonuclease V alpha subunit